MFRVFFKNLNAPTLLTYCRNLAPSPASMCNYNIHSWAGYIYTPSFVSGLNAWIVVLGVEHEEYLEAVDLTSYVGTIPTWRASYFLV